MTIVRVKVLFFGMLKDIVGRSEDHIEVADDARVESVFTRYARDFPRLTDLESSIVLACNHEFCDRSSAIREGSPLRCSAPSDGCGFSVAMQAACSGAWGGSWVSAAG